MTYVLENAIQRQNPVHPSLLIHGIFNPHLDSYTDLSQAFRFSKGFPIVYYRANSARNMPFGPIWANFGQMWRNRSLMCRFHYAREIHRSMPFSHKHDPCLYSMFDCSWDENQDLNLSYTLVHATIGVHGSLLRRLMFTSRLAVLGKHGLSFCVAIW